MKLCRVIALIPMLALHANAAPKKTDAPSDANHEFKHESVVIRLLADQRIVSTGTTFTAGLHIQPAPGYHTYWHSPGLVGLPTAIEWQLPKGVKAGPLMWPGPETSKMANLTIWGYRRDVVLLCEISVDSCYAAETLPLRGKVRWMACAKGCHPNWVDLAISIPIGERQAASSDQELIEASRRELPACLPQGWTFSARKIQEEDGYRVEGSLHGPGIRDLDLSGVVFFCDDNQVNSNLKQDIQSDAKGLSMKFPVSELAPDNPTQLSGVLYHPGGWPGLNNTWLRVGGSYPAPVQP